MHIIIPARYESSRFPGKPLAKINGIPIIQHAWNNAVKVTDRVIIATDDMRIYDTAMKFGAITMITGKADNGTERCYEAAEMIGLSDNELVVNLQCDEPYLSSKNIKHLVENHVDMVSTLHYSTNLNSNPNDVKVILNKSYRGIFFTRHPLSSNIHVGIYAFEMYMLRLYHQFRRSVMEEMESLEQMRFIDNDINIYSNLISFPGRAINVPSDIR